METAKLILFFSRGRGHGHAFPDMALADALLAGKPGLAIRFVSYATGAKTLRQNGRDVIDLGLPETNSFLSTLYRCQSLIDCLRPALVIAHEEFAAIAAAKLYRIRSIFLAAWLPAPNSLEAESLAETAEIILMGEPGLFPPPHPSAPPVSHVGDILRKMAYSSADRARARAELEISSEACVLLVASGGWASEARAPIAEVVLDAFQLLEKHSKLLFWMADSDEAAIRERAAGRTEIQVFSFCHPLERWMVASDLVITKGTRGLTLEAANLAVPSISLSARLNPIDDFLVPRIASNIALLADAVDKNILLHHIKRQLAGSKRSVEVRENGVAEAVRLIHRHIQG